MKWIQLDFFKHIETSKQIFKSDSKINMAEGVTQLDIQINDQVISK